MSLQALSPHLPTFKQKKSNSHFSEAEQNRAFQGQPNLNCLSQSSNICLVTVLYKMKGKKRRSTAGSGLWEIQLERTRVSPC